MWSSYLDLLSGSFLLSFTLCWCHSNQALQDPFPRFMFLISFYSLPCSFCSNYNIFSAVLQTFNLYSSLRILAYLFLSGLFFLLIDALLSPSLLWGFYLKTFPHWGPLWWACLYFKHSFENTLSPTQKVLPFNNHHFHCSHYITLFFSVVAISIIIICIFTYWNARSRKARYHYLFYSWQYAAVSWEEKWRKTGLKPNYLNKIIFLK